MNGICKRDDYNVYDTQQNDSKGLRKHKHYCGFCVTFRLCQYIRIVIQNLKLTRRELHTYWIPLLLCLSSLVIWHLQSPRKEEEEEKVDLDEKWQSTFFVELTQRGAWVFACPYQYILSLYYLKFWSMQEEILWIYSFHLVSSIFFLRFKFLFANTQNWDRK